MANLLDAPVGSIMDLPSCNCCWYVRIWSGIAGLFLSHGDLCYLGEKTKQLVVLCAIVVSFDSDVRQYEQHPSPIDCCR